MIRKKRLGVFGLVVLCVLPIVPFQQALGQVSMETKVTLEKGTICISYSSEEDVLRINYSMNDKECQLILASTQRMGLLIQVAGPEITFSLRFLEKEESWPAVEELRGKQYASREIFATPGWVVVVVQQSEQGGETG